MLKTFLFNLFVFAQILVILTTIGAFVIGATTASTMLVTSAMMLLTLALTCTDIK